jgi:hypothetical protein
VARSLDELQVVDDAWPEIQKWAAAGDNAVEITEAARKDGERALLQLQVTTRSVLGALALHAAAVTVDHGWVRVLAAGGPSAPASLIDPVPGSATAPLDLEDGLMIANDALGGFFVVNGGGLPGDSREVLYLAPDSLRWEQTGLGHSDWLRWLLGADLDRFYDGSRWAGWQDEVRDLRIDQAIHTYPPLFTKQGQDIAAASRRAVPIGELWTLWLDFREQLGIAD